MANLKALDKIWKSKAITLETKLSILKTCVLPTTVELAAVYVVTGFAKLAAVVAAVSDLETVTAVKLMA